MNETEHHELRMALGPYVLGHLPPDERARVAAHLDGCVSCTAELTELTPVASALSAVRGRTTVAEPPPELAARVTRTVDAAARRDSRRRITRTATVAGLAAAAVLAIVAGTVALVRPPSTPTVPLEAVPVRVSDGSGVQASANLVNHTWGVEVRLTATGFDRGRDYRVAVLGDDGRRYPAGGFVGTGAASMVCNLSSSVLRDGARGFEVADRQGHVLLTSTFG